MIEIQVHPSDIRHKVRFLFFGRVRVVAAILLCSLLLIGMIGSMAAAPSVIRRVYKSNYVSAMRQERDIQRERLRENVDQMTSLERKLEEHRVRVEKLLTVYGLNQTALGQGGFSLPLNTPAEQADIQLTDAHRREILLKRSIQRLNAQLQLLASYESANAAMVRHTPSILPLPADQFVLTSPFGNRVNPFTRKGDFHKGLDLSAPTGTPIFATADGVVTFAGWYPLGQNVNWWRFGNVVVIGHSNRFITIYGHCNSINVRPGQEVRQGQVIATVGSSGWSTNSHLHYEIRSDLERPGLYDPIDPRIYILNYQWNNEANLLIQARTTKDYKNFAPLPSSFLGRRRG